MLFPVLWYLATLLFFSFVHQKKTAYLLPAFSAQVLFTARGLITLLGIARRQKRAGLLAQSLLGVAFGLSLPVLGWFAHDRRLDLPKRSVQRRSHRARNLAARAAR